MSLCLSLRKRFLFCIFPLLAVALNINAAPLVPLTAVSRQHHNGVGDLHIPLPLAGPPGVECREVNGSCDIVLTFADPVTFTVAGVTTGSGTVSQCENNGTEVIIHLTGVLNAQRITVALSNATDGITTNDISIPMGVLFGDTTGDGRVNSSDVSYVQFESGHAITQDNCRTDVTRNGSINSSDVSAVQYQSGTAVGWTAPSLDRLNTGHDSASLALEPDGSLWTWGQWSGDGGSQPRSYPLALSSIPDPISASAGDGHTSVLAKNGVVWAWGQNQQGQLGDGTIYNTNWPKAILSNVIAIKAGGFHTIALLQDGTLTSWGQNNYGQLGNGDTTSSVLPVGVSTLSQIMQVAAGYERSLALKSNGTVWAWGFVRENQGQPPTFDATPVQVNALTTVTAIAAGRSHAAAVKSDGTVWAWGSNELGQLGNASVTGYTANPVQVSNISNAVSVSSTYDHTLALRSDGTVWAWGANDVGQLGNGTTNPTSIAVQVNGLTGVVAIAAARSYSMAMKADGSIWAWGENTLFLGIVPGGNVLVPQQAILNPLDENGNVMDDRWEMQYFGNLKQSGDDDFDGDGIPNSQEYQNGTTPNDWYNGQKPYPVYRDHTRVAGKQKQGFPTFHVSNPPRFYLQQAATSWLEGGNPEGPVGGVITTTVDNLDTGHTTEQRSGSPFDFQFVYWDYSVTYANNDTTAIEVEHTQDTSEEFIGGTTGAYDDPPNLVTDLAGTLTLETDRTNEYTTEMLINRALAALPPLPPMEAPYSSLDDATFATIHLFPGEVTVYTSHSEYRFEWHVSPHLPEFKQITWLETFAPASGAPTTTVKHWEGTANYTDTYILRPSVPGSYYVQAPSAQFKAQDGKINSGFDPRDGSNADGTPGSEPWTSVVKGNSRNVVNLSIPGGAQLITLIVKQDPDQPEPQNVVTVNHLSGFGNGDNPLVLTGTAGDDRVRTATIEAHVLDGAGHDYVCAKLHVMALPQRTVSLGIYRVEDPDSTGTQNVGGPTDAQIRDTLNDIYAQAGIQFQLDSAAPDPLSISYDNYSAGLTLVHDGRMQDDEFIPIIKEGGGLPGSLKVFLAKQSGVQPHGNDNTPLESRQYARGETPNARVFGPRIQAFVFAQTTNDDYVAALIAAHEVGHVLNLWKPKIDSPDDLIDHDPGPFPAATSPDGGLMKEGHQTDRPGKWLSHVDWQVANQRAVNFQP
jgi:alpha-tubulin suppressor-like RCC1 family protein